ncbi:MBL fold metallo-hydrolase [Olsenella sp. An293]|uniref:MBL fold metallo-hydrolase n=1 Tax=Olsenella sp. An293 TaxID=1965626 RepID=UPI000B5593DE|nr:MBL fold metallo-hydrolase [Olsenella sp. An293]OUO33104.1 hypothetical protein B5F85_03420 [Olsenella sp. An293]
MRVYFLGCAGWIPNQDETSCFMVELRDQLFLLDAGTGVSNLFGHKDVLERYDRITVLLSHYHLDHIIGLIYLLPHLKGKSLHIYGPGVPCYEDTTEGILERLLQPAFFSRPLREFCGEVRCFDYAGLDFTVDGIPVGVVPQRHSAPSFRLTLDNKLIYATDTAFDPSDWRGDYRGMTLLHECWDVVSRAESKHTSAEGLLEGLPPELLRSTYLIHKNPEWTTGDYDALQRIAEAKGAHVACDGMILEI